MLANTRRLLRLGLRRAFGRERDPNAFIRRSQKYQQGGRAAEAERELLRGRTVYPRSLALALELATVSSVGQDPSVAAQKWQAVIEEFGSEAPAVVWLRLSRSLRHGEQFEEAIRAVHQGLSMYPDDPRFNDELSRVTRDARWPPTAMNVWARPDQRRKPLASSPATQKRASVAVRDNFVASRRLRDNDLFVQACAFGGMQLDHSKAEIAIHWADACKRDWLKRFEEDSLAWTQKCLPEKTEFVGQLFHRVVHAHLDTIRTLGKTTCRLTMGLSSGLNSRSLLHAIRKTSWTPEIFTFGQTGNCDYDFVTHFAERSGLPVRFFDTSTMPWSSDGP